jgi:hypothetical protein
MRIEARGITLGGIVLVGFVLASCEGRDRNAPSAPTAPLVTTPLVTRLEVIAPGSIAPGESVQLTANAIRSDNSIENVTSQAQWLSSDSRVLHISSTGSATGIANGEAVITARYQNRGASTRTLVLPPGTYRLNGRVSDGGFALSGVTLTIGDKTTVTSAGGTYTFYGVSGRVSLHAQRDGYLNKVEEIEVVANRTFDFEMAGARPRPDFQGAYTLTVGGASCPASFVASAATRTYVANATQVGSRLTLTLSGADFIITAGRGNHFDGFVDTNDSVTFTIGDVAYYYYYGQYDVVERFSDTVALIVAGTATVRPSPSGLSGTLIGSIRLAQGITAPFTRLQATCTAANHRFEMVRR